MIFLLSKSIFRKAFIYLSLAAIILNLTGNVAYALDEPFYSGNDIQFYDPTPPQDCSSNLSGLGGSSPGITGSSNVEKIWNWLIAKGMTPIGAAGIMGNMQAESGLNPFRLQVTSETYATLVDDSGYNKAFGLVQWDGGRRVEVLKYIAGTNTSYRQYVDKEYGNGADAYKNAPPEINDIFIRTELEYMYKESTPGGGRSTTWDKMMEATSPESAADTFEEIFEGSVRGAGGVHSDLAKQIYTAQTGGGGESSISSGSPSSCVGGGGVDSNEVITEGGLTEDQAKKFMMNYGENKGGDSIRAISASPYGQPSLSAPGGRLSNCTAFSAFFVNKFTATDFRGGDGGAVVSNLRSGGEQFGRTPKVWAVFSITGSPGHTGVVLGIHGDTVIVGHASYGSTGTGRGNGTYEGGGAGFIKTGKLGTSSAWYAGSQPTNYIYPKNVDTNKIQAYVNGSI